MRKLAILAVGAAAMLAAVAFGLPPLLNTPALRARVQAEVEKSLGRKVTFAAMDLRALPPTVTLSNVVVADLARAREFSLRLALWPLLLRRSVQVDSLSVAQPAIELVRDSQGAWNYASLGGASSARDGSPPLVISRLSIDDGQVGITDHLEKRSRAQYDHIDVALRNYGSAAPFGIAASLRLPGGGKQRVRLEGTGKAGGGGFDGKLRLEEASIQAIVKFLNLSGFPSIDAAASGETSVSTRGDAVEVNGRTTFTAPQATLAIAYKFASENGRVRVDSVEAKVGELTATASGEVATDQLALRVRVARASIADLARLASIAGVAFNRDVDVRGQVAADLAIRGARNAPTYSGVVDAESLVFASKAWREPIRVPTIRLNLTPDEIRAGGFGIEAGSTKLGAAFALRDYAGGKGTVTASASVRDASLEELLRIGKAFGVGPGDVKGTGTVTVDVRAKGPLNGALALSGSGEIRNAKLELPALAKPLSMHTATVGFAEDSVRLQNVQGALGSSNFRGALTLRNFRAPRVDMNLAIDHVDVADLAAGGPDRSAPGKRPVETVSGTGKIEIGKLVNGGLVLENVRGSLTLGQGVLNLDPLSAEIFGGKQSGAIIIDLRPERARYAVRVKLDGVDAARLLSATTGLRAVQGPLSAQADIQFALGEADQIARSLGGKVALRLAPGRIVGVNLFNELAQLGQFVGLRGTSDQITGLASLTATMDIRDGIGTTSDLSLQLADGGTVSATGTVNLNDQTVNLKGLAMFGRELAERVGGSKVGGYLTAALLNQKGELVMPTLISGPMGKPRIVPDAQRMAELKARSLTQGITDVIQTGKPARLLDILKGKAK